MVFLLLTKLSFEKVIVHRERDSKRGWRRMEGGRTSWR